MFVCFALSVLMIFPLYNCQKKELLSLDAISEIYLVENADDKQIYSKKDGVSFVDLQKAEGVILVFDSDIDKVKNELNFKQVKKETIDGLEIFYGYTNLYSDFVYVNGKQVNVQIIERENQTVAGFPLILSGF